MRGRGITYDTGFVGRAGNSREHFDLTDVVADLRAIRDRLHCTTVRITGGDPERIEMAANAAVDLGLEVWYSPYPLDLHPEEMLDMFADCARRAERLRIAGHQVVFVAGAELSLMNHGFLPGATMDERVHAVLSRPAGLGELVAAASARVDDFLGRAVPLIRGHFGGRVTYASIPFERVDWSRFDIVSVDLYRSAEIADRFADGVRDLVAQGKPVAITEFGCATYRGAADVGARGLEIVRYDPGTGRPVRLDGQYARDEDGQAAAVREHLEVFDAAGVDTVFVFLFALEDMPSRADGDPRDDLDLASYGIVRVLDRGSAAAGAGRRWEPKAAFHVVAEFYRPAPVGKVPA